MANMSITGAPQSATGAVWQSNITRVEETPEMKARRVEEDARVAQAQAVDQEYRAAWVRKASGESGLQFGDLSQQSPQQAAGNLAAITKLRDVYGENGLQISAARGEEKTTSLSTYITWLQERAATAPVDAVAKGSLFSLKV
ncbi:MAG: hypothetical protein AB1542_00955 [Pseudomonadota bacterium]